ncbi:MAG: hypothetical protein M1831_004103 [Alyxoria varia]|nr:MAG: hypothetical protein M1831_004103 [Alyxoria varia]
MEYTAPQRRVFSLASMKSWSRDIHTRLNIPFTDSQNLGFSDPSLLQFVRRSCDLLRQKFKHNALKHIDSSEQQRESLYTEDNDPSGCTAEAQEPQACANLQRTVSGTKRGPEDAMESSSGPTEDRPGSGQSSTKRRRLSHSISSSVALECRLECRESTEHQLALDNGASARRPPEPLKDESRGSDPPIFRRADDDKFPNMYPERYLLAMIESDTEGRFSIPVTGYLYNTMKACVEARRKQVTSTRHLTESRNDMNPWCNQLGDHMEFLQEKRKTIEKNLKSLPHSYFHNQLKAIDIQVAEMRRLRVEAKKQDDVLESDEKRLRQECSSLEYHLVFNVLGNILVRSNMIEEFDYRGLEKFPYPRPPNLEDLLRDRTDELAEFWVPPEDGPNGIRGSAYLSRFGGVMDARKYFENGKFDRHSWFYVDGRKARKNRKSGAYNDRIGDIAKENGWWLEVPKAAERAEERIRRGEVAMADVRRAQEELRVAKKKRDEMIQPGEEPDFEEYWEDVQQQSGNTIEREAFDEAMAERVRELEDAVKHAQFELDHYVAIGRRQGLMLWEDGERGPERHKYGAASNNLGIMVDDVFAERVAQWVDNEIPPEDSEYWESSNGPGTNQNMEYEILPVDCTIGSLICDEKWDRRDVREKFGVPEKRRNSVS